MKRKILRSFLAVYLAVSLVYGGARAAYLTVVAAMEPTNTAEEQLQLAAPASFEIDMIPAEPKETAGAASASAVQEEDISRDEPLRFPKETSIPEESTAPIPEEPAADSTIEAPAEDEEALIEAAPAEDEEALIEAAPAEDVPTLEDYLGQLHCGRCGRNCYLANPHCRTGRNKAESASEAYYEEYGITSEM